MSQHQQNQGNRESPTRSSSRSKVDCRTETPPSAPENCHCNASSAVLSKLTTTATSKPRPIHAPPRTLMPDSPDPMEPSKSYGSTNGEDHLFLNDKFMLADFKYHNDSPLSRPKRIGGSIVVSGSGSGGGAGEAEGVSVALQSSIRKHSRNHGVSIAQVVCGKDEELLVKDDFFLPPAALPSSFQTRDKEGQFPCELSKSYIDDCVKQQQEQHQKGQQHQNQQPNQQKQRQQRRRHERREHLSQIRSRHSDSYLEEKQQRRQHEKREHLNHIRSRHSDSYLEEGAGAPSIIHASSIKAAVAGWKQHQICSKERREKFGSRHSESSLHDHMKRGSLSQSSDSCLQDNVGGGSTKGSAASSRKEHKRSTSCDFKKTTHSRHQSSSSICPKSPPIDDPHLAAASTKRKPPLEGITTRQKMLQFHQYRSNSMPIVYQSTWQDPRNNKQGPQQSHSRSASSTSRGSGRGVGAAGGSVMGLFADQNRRLAKHDEKKTARKKAMARRQQQRDKLSHSLAIGHPDRKYQDDGWSPHFGIIVDDGDKREKDQGSIVLSDLAAEENVRYRKHPAMGEVDCASPDMSMIAQHLSNVSRSSTLMSVEDGGEEVAVSGDAMQASDEVEPCGRSLAGLDEVDREVHRLLDRTGRTDRRQKKKLLLSNLNLSSKDVPVSAICARPLGDALHKLSLAGNRLLAVPARLVSGGELCGLHTLDLQQCDLTSLPHSWKLPNLRRLILSHNRLEEFLDESMLVGLPELRHLDMYDNKLCEVVLPSRGDDSVEGNDVDRDELLSKLEYLNLGFNNLVRLPYDLPRLKHLRTLKVTNNLITHIPRRVALGMDQLKELEVTPNPLILPPIEDCERGLDGMRRYYRCLATRGADDGRGRPCDDDYFEDYEPLFSDAGKLCTSLQALRKTFQGGAARFKGAKGSKDASSWSSLTTSAAVATTLAGSAVLAASAKLKAASSAEGTAGEGSKSVSHSEAETNSASPFSPVRRKAMMKSIQSKFHHMAHAHSHFHAHEHGHQDHGDGRGWGLPGGTTFPLLRPSAIGRNFTTVSPKENELGSRVESRDSTLPAVDSTVVRPSFSSESVASFASGPPLQSLPRKEGCDDDVQDTEDVSASSSTAPMYSISNSQDRANVVTDRMDTTVLAISPRNPSLSPLEAAVEAGSATLAAGAFPALDSPKISREEDEPDDKEGDEPEDVLPGADDAAEMDMATKRHHEVMIRDVNDAHSDLVEVQDGEWPQYMTRNVVEDAVTTTTTNTTMSKSVAKIDSCVDVGVVVGTGGADGGTDDFAVNDTLKIIFVGMAYTGKTSIIRRLKHGLNAPIPKMEERTIGVDIYEWDPKRKHGKGEESSSAANIAEDNCASSTGETEVAIDTRVMREDGLSGETDVKFSVWDFAGQNVYHATHELFFSPRALYVLVWDMAVNNREIRRRSTSLDGEEESGPFRLSYDSSEDETESDSYFMSEQDARRADRALERAIDETMQFWVDCIQSSVPGAAILPVASFDDYFTSGKEGGVDEARRRCSILKRRLLQHEDRRKAGLEKRLDELRKGRRANTELASRLRKLLGSFHRPKFIFGTEEGSDGAVLRVSSTKYTGFDRLRQVIVNIATGREHGDCLYPLFRGHVGAVIPRMRLKVRDIVRARRKELKVVEWAYFRTILKESRFEDEMNNADDVCDALHFLSNIGELSYFGCSTWMQGESSTKSDVDDDDDDDDDDEQEDRILAIDNYRSDPYGKFVKGGSGEVDAGEQRDAGRESGLSDFIFLNPRWLVAVVACILRHDLRQEIDETRRLVALRNDFEVTGDWQNSGRGGGFHEANLNCPIITAEEACMLWKTKRIIMKAAERAKNESSSGSSLTAFEFLQKLLIRFNVFVPIDLNVDKALFSGEEYGIDEGPCNVQDGEEEASSSGSSKFFFLPSLLGPGEPSTDVWTYKSNDSWKTTLCVSWSFPDGVPPGLFERISASVLRDIYAVTQDENRQNRPSNFVQNDLVHGPLQNPSRLRVPSDILHNSHNHLGKLRVHEILCWRTAFLVTIGMKVETSESGETAESVVEIFAHLVDQQSPMCVAADSMTVGMRRLVVSGKGQVGDGGRKIWKGGYEIVTKAVERVVREYGGLEFEKEGVCPECLGSLRLNQASVWNWTQVTCAAKRECRTLRCSKGHVVDTRLIGGFRSYPFRRDSDGRSVSDGRSISTVSASVPVRDVINGVVLVALWDARETKVVRAGTGFIVDRKRGLIVTASHTLMSMRTGSSLFGQDYYGMSYGKALIGVIPEKQTDARQEGMQTTAVFRYFAEIVAKDPCNVDACVLKIKTKLEKDVEGQGAACAEIPEIPIFEKKQMKKEGLLELQVVTRCELEERVRILGYNQGGEGLVKAGSYVNRVADLAEGYVSKIFEAPSGKRGSRNELRPRAEIVAICPTIGGHSGGPCVNLEGEVIGILSRADPADKQRCYLVPSGEFMKLVNEAKRRANPVNELRLI